MLQNHHSFWGIVLHQPLVLLRAVINDVNPDLTTFYLTVRDMPEELIASLADMQNAYNLELFCLRKPSISKSFSIFAGNKKNEYKKSWQR